MNSSYGWASNYDEAAEPCTVYAEAYYEDCITDGDDEEYCEALAELSFDECMSEEEFLWEGRVDWIGALPEPGDDLVLLLQDVSAHPRNSRVLARRALCKALERSALHPEIKTRLGKMYLLQ